MKFETYQLAEGDTIRIPVPESYSDDVRLIKSDIYREKGKTVSLAYIILCLLIHPFASTLIWLRLSARKGVLWPLCKLMYKVCSRRRNIELSSATKIGYGFYIGHGMCMVVNSATIIGNNVNLSQFVNIGTNHNTPAIIGDNVYIGPSVCIVEDVKVGSYTTIGAGAVVSRNAPQNSTVAGCPAKVLNYNNPGRYISNPWIDDNDAK